MNRDLLRILGEWPQGYIHDADLAIQLPGSDDSRYAIVKRALREGLLIRLRRGLYLIGPPIRKGRPDLFELAQQLCSPSAISFETALSYHGWIPEAVYTVYSATPKRRQSFETPLETFTFLHTPLQGFYDGVERLESPICFLAGPWKALGDIAYSRRSTWSSLAEVIEDLRVDEELIWSCDVGSLRELSLTYASRKVRSLLTTIYKELSCGR
jgi:hypothetical protein